MSINYEEFKNKIVSANSLEELEVIHSEIFSKKGFFAKEMKNLVSFSVEEKKKIGSELNSNKTLLQEIFNNRTKEIKEKVLNEKIAKEKIDLSLPFQEIFQGGLHPISYVSEQLIAIFAEMGFEVAVANEIEEDWYNFGALNIPDHHPSRDDHDTFYLKALDKNGNRKVLRTHTSNTQIRTMIARKEELTKGNPIKIIAPGRTYRSDSDATHSPMFHQIEGLYVDKKENISVPLLKSVLSQFCNSFFVIENLPLRFRPSYFPFTSPSYEVDILCDKSNNQLILGKGEQWLEILGSGIVHSNVLENCGIDSDIYGGLAFGMGIERITMLKYGFKDLRTMFNSDVRWLQYYNFKTTKAPSIFAGLD